MGREGVLNKNRQFLIKRLKDMYGDDFEPIIKAAENALRMNKLADETMNSEPIVIQISEDMSSEEKNKATLDASEYALKHRISEFDQRAGCVAAWEKIAQYTSPKLKATEIDTENLTINMDATKMSDEELEQIVGSKS